MLYPEQVEEYVSPITRGDWHVMLCEEPETRPKMNLYEWTQVPPMGDSPFESYVDRCYTIEYNPDGEGRYKWECTVWFDAGDGAFGDTRAINCEHPQEALMALDDSLSSACNRAW